MDSGGGAAEKLARDVTLVPYLPKHLLVHAKRQVQNFWVILQYPVEAVVVLRVLEETIPSLNIPSLVRTVPPRHATSCVTGKTAHSPATDSACWQSVLQAVYLSLRLSVRVFSF